MILKQTEPLVTTKTAICDYLEVLGRRPLETEVEILWFSKDFMNWRSVATALGPANKELLFEVVYNSGIGTLQLNVYQAIDAGIKVVG